MGWEGEETEKKKTDRGELPNPLLFSKSDLRGGCALSEIVSNLTSPHSTNTCKGLQTDLPTHR